MIQVLLQISLNAKMTTSIFEAITWKSNPRITYKLSAELCDIEICDTIKYNCYFLLYSIFL